MSNWTAVLRIKIIFKFEQAHFLSHWEFYQKKKKRENFQINKTLIFFIFLLKTYIVDTRRGGSNEYPQYMFLGKNRKNNVHPCKPQFYYIKVGFKGFKVI